MEKVKSDFPSEGNLEKGLREVLNSLSVKLSKPKLSLETISKKNDSLLLKREARIGKCKIAYNRWLNSDTAEASEELITLTYKGDCNTYRFCGNSEYMDKMEEKEFTLICLSHNYRGSLEYGKNSLHGDPEERSLQSLSNTDVTRSELLSDLMKVFSDYASSSKKEGVLVK